MSPTPTITAVKAAQRLDSRGKPTVQVRITTSDGTSQAIVPSGASKGHYEAIELRDGNEDAFEGNGVLTAVQNVENVLGPAIMEKSFDIAKNLKVIDEFMIQLDGTDDKSKLGANAILGISMACARATAAANIRPTTLGYQGRMFAETLAENAVVRAGSKIIWHSNGLCYAGSLLQRTEWRRPLRQHDGIPGVHDSTNWCFVHGRCCSAGARGVSGTERGDYRKIRQIR